MKIIDLILFLCLSVDLVLGQLGAKKPSRKSGSHDDLVSAFPEPPVCGFSNATFNRVIGGYDAKLGDFPWMALLGYRNPKQWACAGTLVTEKHVLTAAHCVYGLENKLNVVRLGDLDVARKNDGASPVDVPIKRIIMHEHYNNKKHANDIAILVLKKEVEFTDLIRPICMPQSAELKAIDFEDYNPLVAGWGYTKPNGSSSTHLQAVQLPVVGELFCKEAYQNYADAIIDEKVICTSSMAGGKDACKGDSGGPLMHPVQNENDYKTYMYEIGVVSYGVGCARPNSPAVYSRVTHFLPWIQHNILAKP